METQVLNINMNNLVIVKLTTKGIEIYKKYQVHGLIEEEPLNDKNEIRIQLWELFQIFGPSLFVGCDVPFEGNIISVEIKKENFANEK